MKWTKFLLMTVLGIGIAMSSCSEDKIDPTPDRGDGQEESGDAYLALNFSMADPIVTKATEVGDDSENAVNSVMVVLYNASTGNVYKQETMAFTLAGGSYKSNEALQVKRQDYDALILVNPSQKVKDATVVTLSKKAFETVLETDVSLFVDDTNGMFMTNVSGYVNVKTSDLKADTTTAMSTPTKVLVDRAVAKVTVTAKNATNSLITDNIDLIKKPEKVTLSDAKWAINVKNKSSFFMRNFASILTDVGTATSEAPIRDEVAEDYLIDRGNLYAKDNNYDDGITANPAKFDYLSDLTQGQDLSSSAKPGEAGYKSEYALENTMRADMQHQPVTTSILLSLVYTSESIAGPDFYTYNGKLLSQSEITEYKSGSAVGSGELIDIEDVVGRSGKGCDGNDESFTFEDEGITNSTLNYYKGSIVYYNIPIRHFNDTQQPMLMGYGRYGVVRNNVYKMTINSISGPGSPVIDVPELPDDSEMWIGFAFEITPWYVRDNEIDL